MVNELSPYALVVDDDPLIRRDAVMILENAGFQTFEASMNPKLFCTKLERLSVSSSRTCRCRRASIPASNLRGIVRTAGGTLALSSRRERCSLRIKRCHPALVSFPSHSLRRSSSTTCKRSCLTPSSSSRSRRTQANENDAMVWSLFHSLDVLRLVIIHLHATGVGHWNDR